MARPPDCSRRADQGCGPNRSRAEAACMGWLYACRWISGRQTPQGRRTMARTCRGHRIRSAACEQFACCRVVPGSIAFSILAGAAVRRHRACTSWSSVERLCRNCEATHKLSGHGFATALCRPFPGGDLSWRAGSGSFGRCSAAAWCDRRRAAAAGDSSRRGLVVPCGVDGLGKGAECVLPERDEWL